MVEQLRIDVASVLRELEVALKVLTEARIMSRYRRIFKGKGLEFEDFREYTVQDDASRIDWKASKRANKTVIRQYKEERDMNIYVLLDVSASMLFGSTEKLKHEYAAELVAALSHFILQSGDRVGLVLFSDSIVKYVEPSKGIDHLYIMLKQVLTAGHYGGGCDISTAVDYVMSIAGEKSMVFLVSDFIGAAQGWEKAVKLASGKLDGVALIVRDPRDESLPSGIGQIVITDPFSGREMLIDGNKKSRMEYERKVRVEKEHIRSALQSARWDVVEVRTDRSFVLPVINFLKRRELLLR